MKKSLFIATIGIIIPAIALFSVFYISRTLADDVNLPPTVKTAIESRVHVETIVPKHMDYERSLASGFIIAPGYVLTVTHVIGYYPAVLVSDLNIITVGKEFNGTIFATATVVAFDLKNDIVLLKVDSLSNLGPPVKLAEKLTTGEEVYTSGFVLGYVSCTLPGTMMGYMGPFAYNGYRLEEAGLIEGPVEGGFSGGPVFNKNGELVGMTVGRSARFTAILPLEKIKDFWTRCKQKFDLP